MTTTVIPTTADAVHEALVQNPDSTPAVLAEATGLVRSTVSRALVVLEEEARAARRPSPKSGRRGRQPDRWSAMENPSGEHSAAQVPVAAVRLGKGELRSLVLGHVRARPGQEMTPGTIAKALGRSPGAVANALVHLASGNEVVEMPGAPRRYRSIPT